MVERERGSAAELSSVEAEVVERADRSVEGRPFSPIFLVLVVAPLALGAMLLLKDFELVSSQPLWLYLVVIAVAGTFSVLVEPWGHAPDGSLRLYTCLAVHVTALDRRPLPVRVGSGARDGLRLHRAGGDAVVGDRTCGGRSWCSPSPTSPSPRPWSGSG